MNHSYTLHSKTHKSYATKERLEAALKKAHIHEFRHILCKTIDDRWTVVFLVVGPEGFNALRDSGFMVSVG